MVSVTFSDRHHADDFTGVPATAPSLDFATRILNTMDSEHVLETFLAESKNRATSVSPRFAQLWSEIERLSNGGKRFRPALVALAAQGYRAGAHSNRSVESVGAAFELLHSALIIHDDVIDRDARRRHAPTLHDAAQHRALQLGVTPERAEHYGHSVAIIAGDLALSGAHRLVALAQLPPEITHRIQQLLDQAVFGTAAGELMDIDHALPSSEPTVEEVLQATALKTSVYSFEAPLQAGAVVAGAPEEHVAALGRIGLNLGLAFQLADDLLGVFGNGQSTGKSTDADLKEGKHTLLVAEALLRPGADRVRAVLRQDQITDADAQTLRAVLEDNGSRAAVESRARQAAQEAVQIAQQEDLPAELTANLQAVAQDAVERIR